MSIGYVHVWHDGKVQYEHRLVAAEMIGRPLNRGEHVHHINEDKADNRPENLMIVSAAEHRSLHKIDVCKNGHEFTTENTYIRRDNGARQCRTCKYDALVAFRKRHGGRKAVRV